MGRGRERRLHVADDVPGEARVAIQDRPSAAALEEQVAPGPEEAVLRQDVGLPEAGAAPHSGRAESGGVAGEALGGEEGVAQLPVAADGEGRAEDVDVERLGDGQGEVGAAGEGDDAAGQSDGAGEAALRELVAQLAVAGAAEGEQPPGLSQKVEVAAAAPDEDLAALADGAVVQRADADGAHTQGGAAAEGHADEGGRGERAGGGDPALAVGVAAPAVERAVAEVQDGRKRYPGEEAGLARGGAQLPVAADGEGRAEAVDLVGVEDGQGEVGAAGEGGDGGGTRAAGRAELVQAGGPAVGREDCGVGGEEPTVGDDGAQQQLDRGEASREAEAPPNAAQRRCDGGGEPVDGEAGAKGGLDAADVGAQAESAPVGLALEVAADVLLNEGGGEVGDAAKTQVVQKANGDVPAPGSCDRGGGALAGPSLAGTGEEAAGGDDVLGDSEAAQVASDASAALGLAPLGEESAVAATAESHATPGLDGSGRGDAGVLVEDEVEDDGEANQGVGVLAGGEGLGLGLVAANVGLDAHDGSAAGLQVAAVAPDAEEAVERLGERLRGLAVLQKYLLQQHPAVLLQKDLGVANLVLAVGDAEVAHDARDGGPQVGAAGGGPALREGVEELVVANELLEGGAVGEAAVDRLDGLHDGEGDELAVHVARLDQQRLLLLVGLDAADKVRLRGAEAAHERADGGLELGAQELALHVAGLGGDALGAGAHDAVRGGVEQLDEGRAQLVLVLGDELVGVVDDAGGGVDHGEAADGALRGHEELALDLGLAARGELLGGAGLDEALLLQKREDGAVGLVEDLQHAGVVRVPYGGVVDAFRVVLGHLRGEHAVDEVLLEPLVGVVDQQLLVRVALEVLEAVDVEDADPPVGGVVELDDAVDLVDAELEQGAVQVLRQGADVDLGGWDGDGGGDAAALDGDDLGGERALGLLRVEAHQGAELLKVRLVGDRGGVLHAHGCHLGELDVAAEQDARDAAHEVLKGLVGEELQEFAAHRRELLHVVDAGRVAALALAQELVPLQRAEPEGLPLGGAQALEALVEDVVVALVLALELDARELQHVAADDAALESALGGDSDLDELAEPGAVVVAEGFGVAERLQYHVGAHHDLLHGVGGVARAVGEEGHQLLRRLGLACSRLPAHDARLALVPAEQAVHCALRHSVRVRGHVRGEAQGRV
ncbi:SAM-dependent methlyltransferase, putative [Babesia caballi]|uniref:SAM-dependent methlyltransferase, putative n=1 Tax=Babesia caballi TaxID=5871 RepID=A0AAV4LQG4_BABCB|nr:SAM-dependent methlyltransferase, putative [Babesia caballi]